MDHSADAEDVPLLVKELHEKEPVSEVSPREGRPREATLDTVRQIHNSERLGTEARATVMALLAEKGESHVQSLLQAEIQKVKKRESELAVAKKKVATAAKEIEDLHVSIRRATELKAETERVCKVLQSAMKRRGTLTEEATREMEQHRESVKKKVEDNVNDIRAKCDVRKQQIADLATENDRLREEVAKQKKEYDEAYASYQSSWNERETYVEELMRSFREVMRDVESLEANLALVRRERETMEEGKVILQRQLEMYSTQLGEFSKTRSIEDMEKVAIEQRQQDEATIAYLEAEKKKANELRLQFDKEAMGWRTALAAAKREWQKVERGKMLAEKQCRLAQEKMRKK